MDNGTRVVVVGGYPMCIRGKCGQVVGSFESRVEITIDNDSCNYYRTYHLNKEEVRLATPEDLADEKIKQHINSGENSCDMMGCSNNSIHEIVVKISTKYKKSLCIHVCDKCFEWFESKGDKRTYVTFQSTYN